MNHPDRPERPDRPAAKANPWAIDEILVDRLPDETRVALLSQTRLVELRLVRPGDHSLVGAIYRGRVAAVRREQSAAFVDIGQAKAGFLSLRRAAKPPVEGSALVVQVTKDAVDEKGPGLTDRPTMVGRFLTLRVGSPGLDRSRRLDPEALEHAATVLGALDLAQDGFLLHPAAADASDDELLAEARSLADAWAGLRDLGRTAPSVMKPAPDPVMRAIQDHARTLQSVLIDSAEALAVLKAELEPVAPALAAKLRHHQANGLFARHDVEGQIADALASRVLLRRGGEIFIDELEALTVVDVDMAAQAGPGNQADNAFQVNQEAALEIARQLRLRDIGGVVVIDFLRMASADHRRRLVDALRRACSNDPQQIDVLGLTPAGLVEVTRKRLRPSLAHLMLDAHAARRAPSPATQAMTLARTILRQAAAAPGRPVKARAAPAAIKALESAKETLALLRARVGATLTLVGDPTLPADRSDVSQG